MGLFHWEESLQVSSAHRLVTSLEQFRAIVQIIESNDDLAKRVKRIRWQHGAEEIRNAGRIAIYYQSRWIGSSWIV
jgi:hypothetical protein